MKLNPEDLTVTTFDPTPVEADPAFAGDAGDANNTAYFGTCTGCTMPGDVCCTRLDTCLASCSCVPDPT